ncbi:hypothetical protein [Gordonia phthalatica]|uniref:Secreted protein n=1 Tax=Gordonia phthalatica TaxID=1136941 RepID=A0A0N9NMA7_9ACTN|nr:hypothetical protein [Gordonia phthalatica]ALG86971.1 hypothetical protein ACH46_16225 [Gordonia phthalatica]
MTTILKRAAIALAAVAVTLPAVAAAPADAATTKQWAGSYRFSIHGSQKTGTSLAATQREANQSAVFRMSSTCTTAAGCNAVATGPAPSNPTVPTPPKYKWNGTSWVNTFSWQWDCYQGAGVPKVWAPAQSTMTYTPNRDGMFRGVWQTTIASGPCAGTVTMPISAVATVGFRRFLDGIQAG